MAFNKHAALGELVSCLGWICVFLLSVSEEDELFKFSLKLFKWQYKMLIIIIKYFLFYKMISITILWGSKLMLKNNIVFSNLYMGKFKSKEVKLIDHSYKPS